jgi:hypothetical protein
MAYNLNFPPLKEFSPSELRSLIGVVGLYFIALKDDSIRYPFGSSRLLYIGMSEKQTNSVGSRLLDHYSGASGNLGIFNYRKSYETVFTHLNFESTKNIWQRSIEDLESYFILDFLRIYGVYPVCNNKSGYPDLSAFPANYFQIDWRIYE